MHQAVNFEFPRSFSRSVSGTGAVLIGTSQSWANNSASQSLTVSAPISIVSGTQTLTLNGTGVGGVTLSGVVSDGGWDWAHGFPTLDFESPWKIEVSDDDRV